MINIMLEIINMCTDYTLTGVRGQKSCDQIK